MDLMLSFLPWYISRSRLLWSFPKSFRRSKIFKTVSATTRGFTHIRYIISSTHLATDYCSSNMPSGYCSSSSGRNTSGFSGTGRGNQNTRPSHSSYSRDTTQSGSRSGSDRYTGSSSRPAYGSSTSRSSYTRDNTYSSYGPGFSTSQSHSRYGRARQSDGRGTRSWKNLLPLINPFFSPTSQNPTRRRTLRKVEPRRRGGTSLRLPFPTRRSGAGTSSLTM